MIEFVEGYRSVRLYPTQMAELTMLASCGFIAGLGTVLAGVCVAHTSAFRELQDAVQAARGTR